MKKYHLLTVSCAFCVALCYGQGTWKFRSDAYAGMAIGQMGGYGLVETVNGFYNGPWFLGLGTGLDYYRFRTVPLFLSVTRDILAAPKKGGLYLLANGGINLPWYGRDPLPVDVTSSKFYPGIWWNTGVGYRRKLSPRSDKALMISAAYGIKRLTERQTNSAQYTDCNYCGMPPPPLPGVNDFDYVNRVLLFSIGYQF